MNYALTVGNGCLNPCAMVDVSVDVDIWNGLGADMYVLYGEYEDKPYTYFLVIRSTFYGPTVDATSGSIWAIPTWENFRAMS